MPRSMSPFVRFIAIVLFLTLLGCLIAGGCIRPARQPETFYIARKSHLLATGMTLEGPQARALSSPSFG